jgi:drug/metabolite transporter (DMT)-like permease
MDMTNPLAATPTKAEAPGRRLAGIALMCGALICFACLDASAKWAGRSVDPLVTTWARYAFSVVLVSIVLNPITTPGLTRTRRPLLQIGRSLLLLISTALNFLALQHLQLTQTVSIQFAAPLIIALMAGPLLGERMGPRRLAAVVVGFLGVLVVTRPGFGGVHPAALYSVAGAVCYALYNISTRFLAAHDSSATTLFYSGLAGVVVMTPVLPFVWTAPPAPLVWVLLAATGLFGAVGHWLLILAHARAPAGVLAPFIYTQLLWMLGAGYLVFGDVPDRWTLAGASIVIASGLYLLYRERGPRAKRR